MIVHCGACSTQNFVSTERLAVRGIPPRCWKCGREMDIDAVRESPDETRRIVAESNEDTDAEN